MKRIIFIFAVFLGLSAKAYEPLIREDRIWEYFYDYCVNDTAYSYLTSYKFEGKQEVKGIEYHQFRNITSNVLTALLREDSGKIYILCEQDNIGLYNSETKCFDEKGNMKNHEMVLYDFTHADQSDEFLALGHHPNYDGFGPFEYLIVPYHTISIKNVSKYPGKLFTLQNMAVNYDDASEWFLNYFGEDFDKILVVEGIGNVGLGDFIKPETPCRLITTGYSARLKPKFNNLYDLDGNVIYPGANEKIAPNGVGSVQSDANVDSPMYDLFGRVITDPAPGTVYIRNGRKEIAR